MLAIIEYLIKQRMHEPSQFGVVKNNETVIVNEKFREVLKLSFEVKAFREINQLPKKKKKNIKKTEVKMDNLFENLTSSTDTTFDDIIVLAIAYMNVGLMYVACTEETQLCVSKNYFMKCNELLKGKELERKAILTAIRVRHELRLVFNKLKKTEESDLFLDQALELYLKYTKEENKYPDPINVPTILGIEDEENFLLSLEQLHLMTVDYLVNQYHKSPGNKEKLIIYIHTLLNKQLFEALQFLDIECYYWALASCDITQYFILKHRFTEAKHHLAAADYMMERLYKDKLIEAKTRSESLYTSMLSKYQHARATIARYWSFYGITLLRSSKERLCRINNKCCKIDGRLESLTNSKKESENLLLFPDLEKDLECITSKIPDTYVLNLDEAKVVFVSVLRWLDTARSYFTIEKQMIQHGRIIIEISKAYKYFAYYEQCKFKQIKLYKLQVEILENAIKQLHLHAKTNEEQEICKHIHFDLGIAYSAFLDIKCEKMHDNTALNFEDLNTEVKQIVENAVTQFKSYLNH
ncbi:protein KBP homolog [Nylanderia fulva]|uniref:protein KBP homolog n=1 Tax=Nylanderia fulva TaxID=613905 RepID=UPI0010FB9A34|nr:protein KBP homolog [Nylanderia fulva]